MPLDPSPAKRKDLGFGVVEDRFDFAVERRPDGTVERVPIVVVHPRARATGDGRRPAVLVLHGTGGNKDSVRSWLYQLAHRGFVAVAIDARYHGDRSGGKKGADAYVAAITAAWRAKEGEPREHPFYYDTCWDVWRTLDYLQTRDDVDPDRLGLLGISMGGIETWLAGAVDDRVKVAVPAIAVQSFRWSLDTGHWQGRAKTIQAAHDAAARDLGKAEVDEAACRALWEKVVPGLLDRFDGPSMLRLFAGRALLIISGDQDPNCPIEGARLAFVSARQAFSDAKASDHLRIMVGHGVGHQVTPHQNMAALAWFEKWLGPVGLAEPVPRRPRKCPE